MKILIIVGARPNFIKIAPIINEIKKFSQIQYKLIHTGQHFDKNMSDSFFEDLGLPFPDINLNINGGSVSDQIGKIMIEFDKVIKTELPDYVLVVGDVNSTVATAITAKQNGIKVIHVEAGLRSFDNSMPEEINRILTDRISDYLFITEESGINNLKNEGITNGINLVGNVMIDCLVTNIDKIKNQKTYLNYNLEQANYGLITLHRPSNVDNKEDLEGMLRYFTKLSNTIKLILPIHPRTGANIKKFSLDKYLDNKNIITTSPLGYIDFINLLLNSKFILTDSGGVQEESTFLQIPCLTMRENTERPVTCDIGSNILVGTDFNIIDKYIEQIISGNYKKGKIPELWDGKASERIIKILLENK